MLVINHLLEELVLEIQESFVSNTFRKVLKLKPKVNDIENLKIQCLADKMREIHAKGSLLVSALK